MLKKQSRKAPGKPGAGQKGRGGYDSKAGTVGIAMNDADMKTLKA